MTGVHDAKPFDVYVDKSGKLWRCVAYCAEPNVIFEEVEGHTPEPLPSYAMNLQAMNLQAQALNATPRAVPILKDRVSGGTRGLMFEGWKLIHRPS